MEAVMNDAPDLDIPDGDDDEDCGLPPDLEVFAAYAAELEAAREAFG